MEYTIHELAELAGVSTRTLRWYDQIKLLRPYRTGENGYRYYSGDEVDRLQQILFYRAIGVELAEIRKLLDDPSLIGWLRCVATSRLYRHSAGEWMH